MLKGLRKNTKAIIWTVILSFGLWGAFAVGTQIQKRDGRLAGEMFGKGVSYQEFDRFYRAGQIFSFAGQEMKEPDFLRKHAWQNIMFSREAQRQKVDVSDDEVRAELLRLLAMQKIENPNPEFYRRWVEGSLRESVQDFEKQVRELLRVQKLIRQVNDAPVTPPSDEEVRKKYLFEQQSLAVEMVKFPTLAEAAAFREKAKDSKKWAAETKKNSSLKSFPSVKLLQLVNLAAIPEDAILRLSELEKDSISDVVPSGKEFAIFRIAEKQKPDEEKFQKEFKSKYAEALTAQKKFQRFLVWSQTIKERAKMKDYLPPTAQPETSTPAKESN